MNKKLVATYVDNTQYETSHTKFLWKLNKYAHGKEKAFDFWCLFYAYHTFNSFTQEMGQGITKTTRFRNDCLKHKIEESSLAHKRLEINLFR